VASHHLADPREVGWPTAGIGEHSGDLAEVGGAEHSRRDDRKRPRVWVAAVIEVMDRAAWYAQRLTRSDLDGRVLDRPRGNALETVDRLFEAVVAVRGRHLAARRDAHFEHRHTSTRVGALDEEANGRVAEADQLAFHCADPTTHRLGPVDERGKIGVLEREIAAWNRGDLGAVIAELDGDHEWDVTRSDIPGEKDVHRGRDAYLGFARRWREALGSTQLEIVEVKELPDGRLFTVLKHSGAGTHSGAEVERRTVQLLSFKGDKVKRTEVYGDLSQGRAAAGLGR
jgi:ketosteroid isomerase-like protein